MTNQLPSDSLTFAVGEVAILCNTAYGNDGLECTVIGSCPWRKCRVTNEIEEGFFYLVKTTDEEIYAAEPRQLRKKRLPGREDHQLTTWDKCLWRPKQVNA